jgi:hypothetical protein
MVVEIGDQQVRVENGVGVTSEHTWRHSLEPSMNREIMAPKAEQGAYLSSQGKGPALTQRQDLDEEKLAAPRGRNQAGGAS